MRAGRGATLVIRAAVGIVGLALAAAGAYGISYWAGLDLSRRWSVYLDRDWYYGAPARDWWPWALGGAGAALLLTGVGLVFLLLRPRRARDIRMGSTDLGELSLSPATLANALAGDISALRQVDDVQARARVVSGRATISFTVFVPPHVDLEECAEDLRPAAERMRMALGDHAPPVRFLLRVAAPSPPSSALT